MADKGKKGKKAVAAAAAPASAPTAAPPSPPPADEPGDKKDQEDKEIKKKPKSVQPKDEVGTRKGCRRYMWEFKKGNREFWVIGHAEVKILSLGCLIAALVLLTGTSVHPLLMLIVTMEMSIFCFFFITYTLAINRYIPFILWPISDLLNDLFAIIFLVGAVVIAVKSRQTMPLHYFIAVILIGMAGMFALMDMCLQRKHFKGKRLKTNVLFPPKNERKVEKPKEAENPPEKAPEKAPQKAEKPKEKVKGGKK
ncbi:CKLF-like MARVEL transmembrane domain-containing protein 2 [Lynx canadensis]|uniref:CKLF-like MARVEL transmembrane domain-containing protein 2 n=1 Tax=Lynx canadensis TaxID=61383 RepID=UPI0011B09D86|nr:CKLF-like MARVEL transmembrane domain-containing protein 2 [Lynx canadensis]